jgi:DNA (cytosine-5)-methyltransferase 1
LQSFPPDYSFAGTRRERVRQIGNAVPPRLAYRVMEALLSAIGAEPEKRKTRNRGRVRCGV